MGDPAVLVTAVNLRKQTYNVITNVYQLNSCYSELCIKWKNPAYRGGQTKMAYFFLLKITYRNTN